MKLRLRPYFRAFLLVAAGLLALLATLFTQPRPAVAADPVAAVAAVAITASGWVDASGGVQKLAMRADGVLRAVPVKEGERVAGGTVLASLDAAQLDLDERGAALDAERLRLDAAGLQQRQRAARAEVERLKPLVEAQAETADSLRTAQAQLADADAALRLNALDQRASQLKREQRSLVQGRQTLRAPAAGQVLRVFARAGESIAAGSPVLSFVPDGPLWVRCELDERLFGRVHPGQSAQVAPEYDDARAVKAKVLRVAAAVGPVQALPEVRPAAKDDRVVEVVLEVDGGTQGQVPALLIGQRVLVRIDAAQ